MKNSLCIAVVLSAYSLLGCASSSNEAGGPHQHGDHQCEHCKGKGCEHCKGKGGDPECEHCKNKKDGEKCEHCKHKQHEAGHEKGDGHEHGHEKGEGHEHGHHGKHPDMTPAVKAFHEVLKPIYHAQKNAARNDQACAATASFKEKAAPIATEAGENAAKKTASANLATSIGDLEKACAAAGKPEVEAKLEKLHDAFHAAMEAK